MRRTDVPNLSGESRLVKALYVCMLFLMGLTGFGQMPIFKRYYIADIPGLGWTAKFYVTHTIHYLGASVLLALCVYAVFTYFGLLRRSHALTVAAWVRIGLLAAIVATGILRVLKNLPGVVFEPGFTMFIDIAHLGFMLLLMVAGLSFALAGRRGWLRTRPSRTVAS